MAEGQHNTENPGWVRERDTDELHRALQAHIATCDHCRETLDHYTPRGFGQASLMCQGYLAIVENYSKTGNL